MFSWLTPEYSWPLGSWYFPVVHRPSGHGLCGSRSLALALTVLGAVMAGEAAPSLTRLKTIGNRHRVGRGFRALERQFCLLTAVSCGQRKGALNSGVGVSRFFIFEGH